MDLQFGGDALNESTGGEIRLRDAIAEEHSRLADRWEQKLLAEIAQLRRTVESLQADHQTERHRAAMFDAQLGETNRAVVRHDGLIDSLPPKLDELQTAVHGAIKRSIQSNTRAIRLVAAFGILLGCVLGGLQAVQIVGPEQMKSYITLAKLF